MATDNTDNREWLAVLDRLIEDIAKHKEPDNGDSDDD